MSVSDEELLARLRAAAAEADPPPELAFAMARAAFGLRDLDAQVAELVADSLDSATAVRGTATVRMLSFEAGAVTIDMEVEPAPTGGALRLVGQVEGADGEVVLDFPRGTMRAPLDDLGRFVLDGVPPGPVRLRVLRANGGIVATSWTTV